METIETLSKKVSEMELTLVEIKNEITKLYNAVVGNQELDQQGMISRIKKLEEESENNKAFKNKMIGMGALGGTITALVIEGIRFILTK